MATIVRKGVEIEDGRTTRVELTAAAGLVIEGIVVDAAGGPVADAAIDFSQAPLAGETVRQSRRTKSGPDGRFRIDGLLEGEVRLRVDAPGFDRMNDTKVAAGARDVRITLVEPRRITFILSVLAGANMPSVGEASVYRGDRLRSTSRL